MMDDPKALPIEKKQQWNQFIDFLDKNGYKGNPQLDDRSTGLGEMLMAKYKKLNPNVTLNYSDVPLIQGELQNYRQGIVSKWRQNPAIAPGVKSEDEIMPGLSQADGWLGSKTSSYKYPSAVLTDQSGNVVKDYGVNTGLYDNMVAAKRK